MKKSVFYTVGRLNGKIEAMAVNGYELGTVCNNNLFVYQSPDKYGWYIVDEKTGLAIHGGAYSTRKEALQHLNENAARLDRYQAEQPEKYWRYVDRFNDLLTA